MIHLRTFEIFSERVEASVMNEFMNVSVGLKRRRLKIHECFFTRHEACENYGDLVGFSSKIQVASDNEKGGGEMRRPEEI
jgi:hypothetical protein